MIFWIAAGAVVFLDQLTKYLVREMMQPGQSIRIIGDFFKMTFTYNPGGAFGFMAGSNEKFRLPFFLAATAICICVVFYYHRRMNKNKTLMLCLGMILGGAVGNLIDRLSLGVITDFLEFGIKPHYWPVFNVADSCICIGACIILIVLWPENRNRKNAELIGTKLTGQRNYPEDR